MGLRVLIAPYMTTYTPKVELGLPPLPFTSTEPFQQLGIRPSGGGKIKRATGISGIGNGRVKLVNKQTTAKQPGKTNSTVGKASGKTKVYKAKKSQKSTGNYGKLVNGNGNGKKKARTFQKAVKSARKAVSRFILGKGGRQLSRDGNGRFIKGGK